MVRSKATYFIIILSFILLEGCARNKVELGAIYGSYKNDLSPVVIVHGIKGADLKADYGNGDRVWGNPKVLFPDTYKKIGLWVPEQKEIDEDLEKGTFKALYQKDDKCASDILDDVALIKLRRSETKFGFNVYKPLIKKLTEFGKYYECEVGKDYQISYLENGYINEVTRLKQDSEKKGRIFSFYYDWRRDNVLNAVNLAKFLDQIRKEYN